MSLRSLLLFSVVLLLAVLLACSDKPLPPLVATEVEVTRPPPGMAMRAGYLALTNNTDLPIRITAISSPEFASVEMHETVLDGEISRMRPVDELLVPAGETLRLQRGGKHLMLREPIGDIGSISFNLYSDDLLILTLTAGPGNAP